MPVERLVDDLWDGDPPRTAIGTVQSYGPTCAAPWAAAQPVIERMGDGYRLAVDPRS